ncbi:YfbM family protein [Novosphingobium sp.]|uniref:YfbM family protein n=1 Tax=Novosphingobium sp. TaxID=1874826 RepID=UPI0025E2C063|nr:YfbM family protein [Novosphingobium sp.]MCC6924866.1 YfbM family protein [Novosphingobium sp.]
MGIAYCLIRTSPENVEVLRNRPKALAEFIFQEDGVYEEPAQGFLSRLFGRAPKVDTGPVPDRSDNDETDLDKAWHVIHYLLCGDTGRGEGPLALIGDDLHPIADLDLGLGKPNLISPDSVRAFAAAVSAMTIEQFLNRYVPDEMPLSEIYMGNVIERGDVDDIREYAVENFENLRQFAQEAASRGEAIITYYT